ncbi:hypothetical protein D3C76_1743210 [compost metagenome]
MVADNLILIGLDIEAGVLLGNAFYRRQQGGQVFQITGVSADSIEQRLALIAVTLVAHIENIFQFRVMSKHAIVEVGGQFGAGFG